MQSIGKMVRKYVVYAIYRPKHSQKQKRINNNPMHTIICTHTPTQLTTFCRFKFINIFNTKKIDRMIRAYGGFVWVCACVQYLTISARNVQLFRKVLLIVKIIIYVRVYYVYFDVPLAWRQSIHLCSSRTQTRLGCIACWRYAIFSRNSFGCILWQLRRK